MLVTDSILQFLSKRPTAQVITRDMEIQVNVDRSLGYPLADKRSKFSDGSTEFWNIRIPKNAKGSPVWEDYKITWPLDTYALEIGSTGWNWRKRESIWVGFDFDSITNHAAGVGVTVEQLEVIRQKAAAIPWVETRRSTSGAGIHLYVDLPAGVATQNHTEHAAVARVVLGIMGREAEFDFARAVDACGGNMWIWSKRATPENLGLTLMRAAESEFPAELLVNWQANVEVVQGRRSKVRINVAGANTDEIADLSNSINNVPLSDRHREVIDKLRELSGTTLWVSDYHMLHTHTGLLKQLFDDGSIQGVFDTNTSGTDLGSPNCFMYPQESGWRVYRFSQRVVEADSWETSADGWVSCNYDCIPTLRQCFKFYGAVQADSGYSFKSLSVLAESIRHLGFEFSPPAILNNRQAELTIKSGKMVVKVAKQTDDPEPLAAGWLVKGKHWQAFVGELTKEAVQYREDEIRALITTDTNRAGWMVRGEDGSWLKVNKDDAKSVVASTYGRSEADPILGQCVTRPWMMVNVPFESEYPGSRQWNLDAAQLVYRPTEDEDARHPHWDMVFDHTGGSLDLAVRDLEWAKDCGIQSGRDYLLTWVACLIRHPFDKLPFIFLYGPQNSGKSILHESLATLFTKGVASADRALSNAGDFNGELANCILAYIEERDLGKSQVAYNRLKDWVTSPTLWIRKMRTDSFSQPNTLHFIQCANEVTALTIKPGDTRITMSYVPPLDDEIPKPLLLSKLHEEAPALMRTLMEIPIPPAIGRLRLPVVTTDDKLQQELLHTDPVELFLNNHCWYIQGERSLAKDFVDQYTAWLVSEGYPVPTSRVEILNSLPSRFPCGLIGGTRYVGNLSLSPAAYQEPSSKPFRLYRGNLEK